MGVEQSAAVVPPSIDRNNGLIYATCYALIYFSAPVVYVGVVHAALCDQLGASATVANLPASAYFFGFVAPVLLAWVVPKRLERHAATAAYVVTAASLLAVFITLAFPFADPVRLGVVIAQALASGFSDSTAIVYLYQCLRRGTTLEGRARAFKLAYSFGPLFAVAGSLVAQFVLGGAVTALPYPRDFAGLYFVGAICMGAVAVLTTRFRLLAVEEEEKQPFGRFVAEAVRSFVKEPMVFRLWMGYLCCYLTLNAMSNLSLYTRAAVATEPRQLSGVIMALRFGFKSVGGWLLGLAFAKKGVRLPVVVTVALVCAAVLWAWTHKR